MPKEVLIYGSIEQWSVADFIKQIDESEGDLVIRVNSKGGSPEYGFGLVAKLKEYEGRKTIKVDGTAFSFGAFLLAYADEVEALDVAEFMIHRAAYPAWFEQSAEYFTDELKGNLARVNKSLRTAFENKIDVDAFAKLKGVTMDELFSMDSRKDVFLSAKEAKKIGLINKITTITPEKKAEIDSIFVDIAAKYNGAPTPTSIIPTENKTQKIETKMTIEDLKSQHPSVYASAFKAGEEAGVSAERDRVGAWLTYVDADAKAVSEGIASGKQISATAMAELNRKAFSQQFVKEIEADGAAPEATATGKPAAPAAEPTALDAFETELNKTLKIN